MSEALYAIKFFNVTIDGSVLGPSSGFKYSVPKFGNPGHWHSIPKRSNIKMCTTGFHVPFLDTLKEWREYYDWCDRVVPYIVQLGGDYILDMPYSNCAKAVFRRIRLIRELDGFTFNSTEINVLNKEYRLLSRLILNQLEDNFIQYKE